MAIKPQKNITTLSFVDIVLGADATTIKAAYEAKTQIDVLLSERQEIYERIAQLETEIDNVMGEQGVFIFPPPPYPVAGYEQTIKASKAITNKKNVTAKIEIATNEEVVMNEDIDVINNENN